SGRLRSIRSASSRSLASAGAPTRAAVMLARAVSGSRKKSPVTSAETILPPSTTTSATTSFPPGVLYSPCLAMPRSYAPLRRRPAHEDGEAEHVVPAARQPGRRAAGGPRPEARGHRPRRPLDQHQLALGSGQGNEQDVRLGGVVVGPAGAGQGVGVGGGGGVGGVRVPLARRPAVVRAHSQLL